MAGLSGILNIGYHGTSPANLRSISTSGFTGGVNPSWAGKGNVFVSTPKVASTYGPSQLGVVKSAKNLTLPGGGIPGKTFTESLKNIGKTKFGFETALKPGQATKGMNLYNKLMSGAYTSSPTAQRLLTTGTTAITNPTNWARVLGLPLSALTGILSSTPVNADEVEWEKELMEKYQLQNKKKQQVQLQKFKNIEAKAAAEAAAAEEAKTAADAKAKADAAAHKKAQATGGDYHSGHQSTVDGQTTDWGSESAMIARGGLAQHAPRYANGGLINFYRYGGFIG
jgi:hypothetical protein